MSDVLAAISIGLVAGVGITVLCDVGGIAVGWWPHRHDKRCNQLIPGIAAQLGFEYAARDDSVMQWFGDKLLFYPHADYCVPVHVMRGQINRLHTLCRDLEFVSSAGSEGISLDKQTIVMFYLGENALPRFELIN